MRKLALTGLASTLVAGAFAVAGPAHAAPVIPAQNGAYPLYPGEGTYPKKSCGFRERQRRAVTFQGRRITLRYLYSGRCGSYARIDNALRTCWAAIERSLDRGRTISTVWETVDPGINFAYTQLANNLNGREARAALFCNGTRLAETNWH